MRIILGALAVCGIFLLSVIGLGYSPTRQNQAEVSDGISETIFTYPYNGHKFELVYTVYAPSTHYKPSLALRLGTDGSDRSGDEQLKSLREEVLRLTQSPKPVILTSKMKLDFVGGNPTWAPYYSNSYKYLQFSSDVSIRDDVITVRGEPSVSGYDGYRLWNPKRYQ